MKKFRFLVSLLLVLAVLLTACQTQEATPVAEEESAEPVVE